jgi:signal transduction histidine kinase
VTRRILLSYLSLTLFILLALEIPLGIIYAHHERDGFAADVERDAVVMAGQVAAQPQPASVTRLASDYARATGARVLVVDSTGAVLASTDPAATSGGPELAAALANRTTVGYRRGELSVAVPARTGDTVRGALRITYGTDVVDASATRAWLGLAAAGLLTLGVVTLAGFALARWITRPVRILEDATAAIAGGAAADVSTADIGPPELRRLADRLTATSHALHRLVTAQRSFAAVASHQLRSPLTALRLRLENLQAEVTDSGRAELQAAEAEVDRLTRMVEGLLALARLENTTGDREPVDLDAVVAERVDSWIPYACEQDITVSRSAGTLGRAWAVPGAVEQIIDNLLENAVRVAPPHTTVTVGQGPSVDPGADVVEIHVVDGGPGLSTADRIRAFDRFWRAPDSAGRGSGLGLAIVRQLARASGGDAELRAAPAGGIDAAVRLQRAG